MPRRVTLAVNNSNEVLLEEFNPSDEIQAVLKEFKHRHVKINYSINTEGERTVLVDGTRMRIILRQLIANALDFQKPDAEDPQVQISFTKEQGRIHLVIEDSGIGIDEKIREKIFKMFFRGSHYSNGAGLGLYIVNQVVEKLNGKIAVTTSQKGGALFDVSIPMHSPMGRRPPQVTEMGDPAGR